MKRVLIITKSFVREVTDFLRYVQANNHAFECSVVIPDTETIEPTLHSSIFQRRLFFPWHIRGACFSPRLLHDIRVIRPDILHIFEEISGMIAFQTVLFRNLCGLKSRIFVYSAENIPGNVHPLFRLPMAYVIRQAEQAFVCSSGVKDTLQQEGLTKPITVFPLGVNHRMFRKLCVDDLKARLGLDGKFVIGYCGRLLESKGIFLLVEMMRSLPEQAHLLVVGSGEAEQGFRTRVAEQGVAHRVHLAGNIEYEKLPAYLNCMDIGIVPSQTTPRWKEQFGRAVIELMSCEVPVIGSDSGSIPEVIGEAGRIFPEHDLQACLAHINALLFSPQECERLGAAGRKRVMESYSVAIMSERLLEMYTPLIAR